MSETYKKPQSPLKYNDQYFYPLTTVDQVILDEDNTRLNSILGSFVYTEVEPVDSAIAPINADTLDGKLPSDFAKAPLHKTATILASSWTSTVPYTQTVSVEGIAVEDKPHISPVYSDNLEVALAQKESWGMVSRAKTNSNTIIFMCFEDKPTADIDVQIEVYR